MGVPDARLFRLLFRRRRDRFADPSDSQEAAVPFESRLRRSLARQELVTPF